MRAILASVAVLVFVGFAGAADDEKIDAKKLIGKWEPDEKDERKVIIEFTDKGKFSMTIDDKPKKVEGTYKVNGNKIEVEWTVDGKTLRESMTVLKLTDTELKGKSEPEGEDKGREFMFKKIK